MTRLSNIISGTLAVLAMLPVCLCFDAQAQQASSTTQEIVTVTTADGLHLPSVFTAPAGGAYSGGPAILHLPDGPGTSSLRADDAARFAAEGLAQQGYVNLSLETRYVQSYAFSEFDDAIADVRAAIDMLVLRGFTDVVLSGHGLGTLLAARYLVETGDDRIRAVIFYSPSPNLAEAWRDEAGEDKYWDTVDMASQALKDGGRGVFINLGGGLIFTPTAFLDWYGPTAKTSLTANLAGIDAPLFIAAGAQDPSVAKGRLDQLKSLAFLSPQADTKTYARTGHDFKGARDTLAADTANWLSGLGITPVARINTKVVSVTARDGSPLSGILYEPVSPSGGQNKPAVLIAHGWTGDVMRSVSHWLGRSLAQQGYTALAFQTRSSGFRGIVAGTLESVPDDIAAWVDFMSRGNYGPLIAAGHSTGSLWFSYYLNETGDDRIKGAVYLAPMRDMPRHARLAMGEDRYVRTVLEAQEAVRDNKGDSHLITAPFPQAAYDEDPRQPMYLAIPGAGFTYYHADSFLSYWGPASKAVHKRLVADLDIPVLALGGSRDPFMQGAYLIEFSEAAGEKAEYIFYGGPDGATNAFDDFETRTTEDIAAWLNKNF